MHIGSKYNFEYYKNIILDYYNTTKNNIVYMVDLSIQPYTDMEILSNFCKENNITFYWIDHHATAIEATSHLIIDGIRSVKKSGCWLTWNFLYKNITLENNKLFIIDELIIPKVINMISDFDIFNKKSIYNWDEEILPLVYYLESFGFNLNINNLKYILIDLITKPAILPESIEQGKIIFKWIIQQYKNNTRRIYNIEWNDYNCLVLNSHFKGSMQFDILDENLKYYDLLIIWNFNGSEYEYSLYSYDNKIHCGAIAKMYLNGGGHKGAAGGNTKKLIF